MQPGPDRRAALRAFRRVSARWRERVLLFAAGLLAGILLLVTPFCLAPTSPAPPVAAPAPAPASNLTLTLSPSLLTALLSGSLAQLHTSLPLTNIHVQTAPGEVIIRGDLILIGIAFPATIVMQPFVSGGRVVSSQLGSLRVPTNVSQFAQAPINDELANAAGRYPATVTSVQSGASGLTINALVAVPSAVPLQGGG